jgi:DNA polymerase III delta prime subunit
MGTYMFELFRAYPYLHFNGPKGVGKTTALEFLSKVCFNGELASSVSASAQFRLVSACSPTLLLDESEQFHRKGLGAERDILLTGYRKGGSVRRSVQVGKGWRPETFEVYCPKAFASQRGFEDVLGSRTVKIEMRRSRKGFSSLNHDTAQAIRDACFLVAMTYAGKIHNIYQTINDPAGVVPYTGRDYELVQPALALAIATGDGRIVEETTEFAINSYKSRMAEFHASSIEHSFLHYLLDAVGDDGEYRGDVLLKNFEEYAAENDIELSKSWNSKSQGELLTGLGLVDRRGKKRSSDRKTRLYSLKRKGLEDVARAYNIFPIQ